MDKESLLKAVSPELARIEEQLRANFASYVPFINDVSQYILFSGGKRLRPLLMVLAAKLFGPPDPEVYRVSVVFEYLHAATLLHDDVVDEAHMRRGRTAARKVWGNQAVILVGDFLYSKAIRILVEHGNLQMLDVVSETTVLMSEGEVLQLLNADNIQTSEEDYMEVIRRKTAVLIAAACQCGALIAGAKGPAVRALKGYGLNLGLAFQIVDDLLDYQGAAQETGKDIGNDFKEGKVTLPLIIALSRADKADRRRLIELIQAERADEAAFKEAYSLIERYQGFEETRQRAEDLVSRSLNYIKELPEAPEREILVGIARYVLTRRN
ncbi:polyprenyl synthetase family protein [Thermosulfuriphilus sp.]